MEISKLVFTHAVILSTGSHYLISNETHEQLKEASINDLIELENGSSFKVSAVLDILPIKEYYAQFPKRHPDKQVEVNYGYGQPPSFEPEELDYKAITDECIAKVKRSSTEALIRGVKLLEESIRKHKGGTYKEHQMAWACNQELKSRSIFPYFVPEG